MPNGQVLAFVEGNTKNGCSVTHFDLKEMIHCRKRMADYRESQYVCSFFFQSILGLPKEISNHILSYAFTPETKAALTKNFDDEKYDNKKSSLQNLYSDAQIRNQPGAQSSKKMKLA